MTKKAARQLPEGYYMKMAGVVVVVLVLVLCVLGVGMYAYSKCPGFNNCTNPVCEHDCYENGKRVR
jgi:hypothetical protein